MDCRCLRNRIAGQVGPGGFGGRGRTERKLAIGTLDYAGQRRWAIHRYGDAPCRWSF